MGTVVTVAGSVGGIGTSTAAFALALAAGPGTVLIDGQDHGVPLDILIGGERAPGTRWSQVRIHSAAIDAEVVTGALPSCHGLRVLSADVDTADAAAIGYLVQVLRDAETTVVVDLPARHALREALQPNLDLLLLPPTLPGIAAARLALLPGTRIAIVDVGIADVRPEQCGGFLGRPIAGTIRWQRAVRAAATAGGPLPASSDAMRLAVELLATGFVHA